MNLFPQTIETDMEAFKIHYGGQTNQIDANTYINSLLHFTTIVEETNRELSPESKVQVNITAHKEGSFISDIIVLAQTTLEPVINNPVVQTTGYVKTLIETVGGIYNLAKFLGGKKPKSITTTDNSVIIERNDGNITYIDQRVYNYYSHNKAIRNSLSQEFETLADDANVTSFDLLDKNDKPIVEIERKDFGAIANDEGVEITKNERINVDSKAVLSIVTLSFEANKQWEFYYYGNKIKAKLHDDTFTELINKGERFAKGDKLEAELSIKQEYDDSVGEFINTKSPYTITRIIKHIPRPSKPEQGDLYEET